MAEITRETSLQELAAIISQVLEAEGLIATLSGGVDGIAGRLLQLARNNQKGGSE